MVQNPSSSDGAGLTDIEKQKIAAMVESMADGVVMLNDHHHLEIMTKLNMNLTFPIADWLFNTSDLKRGLLGHLFNGYSEKYIKNNKDYIFHADKI